MPQDSEQPDRPTTQPLTRLYDREFNLLWSSDSSDLTIDEYLLAEAGKRSPIHRFMGHITTDGIGE